MDQRKKRNFLLNARDMPIIPYLLLMNPILGTKFVTFSALMWHMYGVLAFEKYGIWNMGTIKERTGMDLITGWERLIALRSKHGVNFDVQLLIQMDKPEGSLEDFNEHLRQHLLKYDRFGCRRREVGHDFFFSKVTDTEILNN